jgi:hypothetical protein
VLVGSTEHFLLPSPSSLRNQEGEGNGFIAAASVVAASVTSVTSVTSVVNLASLPG